MMALICLSGALAGEPTWAGLRDTAQTVGQGDVVVRLPTGVSSVGLTERTELQLQPFDLVVWAPRVSVQQQVAATGDWTVAVRPSLAGSRERGSTRAEVLAGWTAAHHRLGATLAADARWMRQTVLGAERAHAWSLSRVDVPLVVTWDWLPSGDDGQGLLRSRVRTMLHDEGDALDVAVVTESWVHRLGKRDRLFLETGVSTLVGTPSEHVFLGDYQYRLVMAYPRVDLWMHF